MSDTKTYAGVDYVMKRELPPIVNDPSRPNTVIMTADQLKEFLAEYPIAARLLPNYLGVPSKMAELSSALDEFLAKRRQIAPDCAGRAQDDKPANDAIEAQDAPEREFEAPAPKLSVLSGNSDKWAFGLMPGGSVTYLSCGRIGQQAARMALVRHGCVRLGAELREMNEDTLLRKFERLGWLVYKRLRECEAVNDAVRLGFLRVGRPA